MCGNPARTDPCGGSGASPIPTATPRAMAIDVETVALRARTAWSNCRWGYGLQNKLSPRIPRCHEIAVSSVAKRGSGRGLPVVGSSSKSEHQEETQAKALFSTLVTDSGAVDLSENFGKQLHPASGLGAAHA